MKLAPFYAGADTLVSVVTHGEIWALADRNNWGDDKRAALGQMLDGLITVDLE